MLHLSDVKTVAWNETHQTRHSRPQRTGSYYKIEQYKTPIPLGLATSRTLNYGYTELKNLMPRDGVEYFGN